MGLTEIADAIQSASENETCALRHVIDGTEECPDIACRICVVETKDWANGFAKLVGDAREKALWVDENGGIEAIEARMVPEGFKWPRFEDGDYVKIGDFIVSPESGEHREVDCINFFENAWYIGLVGASPERLDRCDRVKRPPVLAADGEPLEVGQTVCSLKSYEEYELTEVGERHSYGTNAADHCRYRIENEYITHQRPVLDADGNRIEPPMDVWRVCDGDEFGIHAERLHVDGIDGDGMVECRPFNGGTSVVLEPSDLYVHKPVLDADGVPIKVGDTVYFTDGREQKSNTVVHAEYDDKDDPYVQLGRLNEVGYPTYTNCSCIDPLQLTHAKPEPPDSRQAVVNEIGDEMAARIDLLVSSGRWSDAD